MKLTDAEWRVMNVVWDYPVEASVRDVLELVEEETEWAYQTVQTIMVRLQKKGALKSRLRANTRLYTPIVSREEAQQTALDLFIERVFNKDASQLAARLLDVGKLDPKTRKEIAAAAKGAPA